jgi:hypothetical protein
MESWGTPVTIFLSVDSSPSSRDFKFSVREGSNQLYLTCTILIICKNVYSRSGYQVASKASSVSTYIAAVDILLLQFRVTWFISLLHWSAVPGSTWKPNWLAFNTPPPPMCLELFCRTSSWNSLPILGKGPIGANFVDILGPCWTSADLCTYSFFQDAGMWRSRKPQLINKCVK